MPNAAVTVRPATADDQWTIWRLVISNNLNALDLDWRRFVVAADDSGQVVGCGQLRDHGLFQELASLVVAGQQRGAGVSTELLTTLLDQAQRPLWLMCESTLINYYERFGFREVTAADELPRDFRPIQWASRMPFGWVFLLRGTHLAFMVLDD